ncbi:MAG: oligosaccharide flippase family protein [Firmicutes bacterium]|nr:oligosaccharide flippase family protein [Bacillota bacterium]
MFRKIREELGRLLKGGFFHILFGGTLTKVVAFISSIVVVRLISKQEYAYLSYADNINSYFFLFSGLGCASAVLKFCVQDDRLKNKAFFNYALKIGSLFQLVLLVGTAVFVGILPLPFPQARPYMYELLLYPMLYYWIGLVQCFMRARMKNREYAVVGVLQTVLILGLSIAFVKLWQVTGVIGARYLAGIVATLYGVYVIRDELRLKNTVVLTKDEKKAFLSFALTLLVANIFSLIMPINEGFLVNNLLKDEVLTSNYRVANLIPQQLPFVTTTIITYFFPIFVKMKNKDEIWAQARKVGLINLLIIVFIAFVGYLVSPWIITMVYGDKYADATWLMNWMWIMYAVTAGIRILPMNILPAIGYTSFNMKLSIASCIVHLIIDYFMLKAIGIGAVGIAGIVAYGFSGIGYWIYLYRKTHEKVTA